jgi:hypothetical protein
MKQFYMIFSLLKNRKQNLRNVISVLSFCFLFFAQQSFAQLYQVAGTCTSLGSALYGPMNSSTNSSATNRTAIIYPATQLTGIANQQLSSIYFNKITATNLGGTPSLKVYLKETSSSDYGAGAADWTTQVTGATLVYAGNPAAATSGAAGWKQLAFSTNFTYSGTNNLMVLFEYLNTGNTTSVTWQYEYTAPCVVTTNSNTTKYINTTTGTVGASLSSSEYRRAAIGFDYVVTCPSTSVPAISNISTNSATATWTAGASETSWDYAVQLSSAAAPTTWSTTTTPTVSLSLNPQTEYIFYVRANCGGSNGVSAWKSSTAFKTLCAPITNMFENFDSYATGNIVPDCWARIIGSSNTAQTISSTTPSSGTRNLYQIASSPANATVVVLPEFSNVNAGTNWLRFKARATAVPGSLDVGYVTSITDASTFVNLQTLSIVNTSYTAQDAEYTVIIPNTVPANARLAIRNAGVSTAGHFIDDLYWEVKPSCMAPTNVAISNITPSSALVQWSASVTPPANGYDVYYNTTNVPPTSATTPSLTGITGTSTSLSLLNPSTSYYVWVRSRCSGTDFSNWTTQIVNFNTLCQPPALLSTTGATVCPNQTATLNATTVSGATLKWYDASTNGNVVGTGNSFITPALAATTNYYVSASTGGTSNVGKVTLESNASTGGGLSSYLLFTAQSDFILNTVDLFPYSATAGTAGTVTVELLTASGTPITSATVNVTGANSVASSVPQTVTLNFPVAGGASYRLGVSAWTGITNMYRDATNLAFPYSLAGIVDITGGSLATPYYYFFYNWKVVTGCESARTMVTATVNTNCLSTSEVDKKDAIKVYPNPFSEVVNLSKPELVKSIRVSDVSGKLIRTFNQAESVLRLNDLSAGMYILQLDMKNGSNQSVKIIKK